MKNKRNKNSFFGLTSAEKARVVRIAADLATKEQLKLVNKYGGLEALKSYINKSSA